MSDTHMTTNIQVDGKDPVPCTLPLPADVGTFVVRASGKAVTIGALVIQPITRVQYEDTPGRGWWSQHGTLWA